MDASNSDFFRVSNDGWKKRPCESWLENKGSQKDDSCGRLGHVQQRQWDE